MALRLFSQGKVGEDVYWFVKEPFLLWYGKKMGDAKQSGVPNVLYLSSPE